MSPEEIATSYDQIASFWSSKEFDQSNGILQHKRALDFCTSRGTAIDIGCGSSGRIISLLLDYHFRHVDGLDLSKGMLARAKAGHPDVTFHHADISDWQSPRPYDFISAWDSVWHVSLDRQGAVTQKLCDALAPGGVLIMTAGGTDEAGDATNPCLGQPLYHATLGIPQLLRVIGLSGCVCRHLEYDQWPEKHLYVIAQKAK